MMKISEEVPASLEASLSLQHLGFGCSCIPLSGDVELCLSRIKWKANSPRGWLLTLLVSG